MERHPLEPMMREAEYDADDYNERWIQLSGTMLCGWAVGEIPVFILKGCADQRCATEGIGIIVALLVLWLMWYSHYYFAFIVSTITGQCVGHYWLYPPKHVPEEFRPTLMAFSAALVVANVLWCTLIPLYFAWTANRRYNQLLATKPAVELAISAPAAA